jgi:HlyD family secretion protein
MRGVSRGLFVVALTVALAACGNGGERTFQGWIEGVFVFVGPDEAGRVEKMRVREGDAVKADAPIFSVDAELQQADLRVAEAALANSQSAFERAQQLLKSGSGSQKAYDDAQALLREADARAKAARTRLTRRELSSPVTGAVQQIYYRPGEMVPAGKAVLSILPPGNVKVRFFVQQAVLPKISLGDLIGVTCDGCAAGISARVSFIASSAEYTPPVIFSEEERGKLVFLVEALPEKPDDLRVGQPVTVTLRAETK